MRAWGRLGAAHGTATPTADGHISGPFFFFSAPPLSAPFPRTALSYSPPSPFPTAGAGGKGRGGGVGKGGRGAGQRSSPTPWEGRGRAVTAPPRQRRGLLRARGTNPASLRALPSRPGGGSQAETARKKGPGALLCTPPCGAQTHCVLGALLPWPQAGGGCSSDFSKTGKVTPNRPKSLRRVPGGMLVSGREVSFRGWSRNSHA